MNPAASLDTGKSRWNDDDLSLGFVFLCLEQVWQSVVGPLFELSSQLFFFSANLCAFCHHVCSTGLSLTGCCDTWSNKTRTASFSWWLWWSQAALVLYQAIWLPASKPLVFCSSTCVCKMLHLRIACSEQGMWRSFLKFISKASTLLGQPWYNPLGLTGLKTPTNPSKSACNIQLWHPSWRMVR